MTRACKRRARLPSRRPGEVVVRVKCGGQSTPRVPPGARRVRVTHERNGEIFLLFRVDDEAETA